MNFLEKFKDCGYFYQSTNPEILDLKFNQEKIVAYIGFDCTAQSLHVGSLMQIMICRLLQKYGHKPIILIGASTTKIGDPTGKDQMRKCLSNEEIQTNIAGIKKSLSKFISFGTGASDAILLDNSDWLEKLQYIDFLRDVGAHISVNRMLTMDAVKSRLDRQQSLSFLELNYMLIQAYDFYHLNKHFNCQLQLGGSDQWGNILQGVELIRKLTRKEAFGLTTPLLTNASGTKMGKTVGGAIWLNEDMLSPYDYFQYWRNVDDADLIKFIKLFAEFDPDQLQNIILLSENNINDAKKQFAHRVTELCHGKKNADIALQTSIDIFEKKSFLSTAIPTIKFPHVELKETIPCYKLLSGVAVVKSNGEARRLIRGKGLKINDIVIDDENLIIDESYFIDSKIKISIGKKQHFIIELQ